jgi:hypothetical protein
MLFGPGDRDIGSVNLCRFSNNTGYSDESLNPGQCFARCGRHRF